MENELGHGHPENREEDHQKRFFKDRLDLVSKMRKKEEKKEKEKKGKNKKKEGKKGFKFKIRR